ncbi:MAG: CvpA family protein [Planctomycetota bacterium]
MNPSAAPSDLAPLDILGLAVVAVLFLIGIWRGLWWQVIRLAGVVAAVALARAFGAGIAEPLREQWPSVSPRLANGIAWIAIFLLTMGAATLLGLLGNRLLQAMHLGFANRVGGGVAGAITGLVLHLAVVLALVQLAPEGFAGRVVAGTYSERLYDTVGSRWPVVLDEGAAAEVDRLLQRAAPPRDPGAAAEPAVR